MMRCVRFVLGVVLLLLATPAGVAQEALNSSAPAATLSSEMQFRGKAEEAQALRAEAGESGDLGLLSAAAEAFRQAHDLMPGSIPADEREEFIGLFAEALSALGLDSRDEAPIREAIALLESQLDEERRMRDPDGWAATQVSIGNTYWAWAAWDGNIERASAALDAFDAALSVLERERDPVEWAHVQNSIGAVYTLLGAAEEGTEAIERAIAAYEAALTVFTREGFPADWAGTTGNLAGALGFLARRTGEPAYFRQALAMMQDAHTAISREDEPAVWARSLVDIAQTAAGIASMTGEVAPLRIAADAYDDALTALSLERDGAAWAQALNDQGLVLIALAEATSDAPAYERAVAALRQSLQFWTRESDPDSYATINWLIGDAALAGGRLLADATRLRDAAAAYAEAQAVKPQDAGGEWSYLGYLHATALGEAGRIEAKPDDIRLARDELSAALAAFQSMGIPVPAAEAAGGLCFASAAIGELTGEVPAFEQAIEDCRQAEALWRELGDSAAADEAKARLEAAEAALAAPAITTARQPIAEMAQSAIRMLHLAATPGASHENRQTQKVLPCTLIERESSAPPRELPNDERITKPSATSTSTARPATDDPSKRRRRKTSPSAPS